MVAVCQCLLKKSIFRSSLPCLQCIVIIDGENSRYAEHLLFLCKYKCFIWFCLTVVFILKQYLEIYTYQTFYGCTKQTIQKHLKTMGSVVKEFSFLHILTLARWESGFLSSDHNKVYNTEEYQGDL